jgi:galactosamine-6-phosphate isomerase
MLKPMKFPDHETMSRHAADWLVDRIRRTPDALLCLAAGATPTRAYQLLAERYVADPGLFARIRVIKLDEWGGLPIADPATCERYLRDALVDVSGLGERYVGFDSRPADPEGECRRVADWLARNGPIDICVLGLGVNGHVGFNEPGPALQPHAHIARLSDASLEHAMLDQAGGRPGYGLTLGMADLLHARRALLLVSGATKREPLRRLLDGPISTEFPASLLSLHRDVRLFCDPAAFPDGDALEFM